MAINKNFVIKHGVEVNTNLIVGDANTQKVGIGTTVPQYSLHVGGLRGGIGASDAYVSGVTTVKDLHVTGITTFDTGRVLIGAGASTGTRSQLLHVGSATTEGGVYISGDVGLGVTLPGAKLNVVPGSSAIAGLFSGTTEKDMVRITQLGGGNALRIDDIASDASPFVVTGIGSVGIGTTNPEYALVVDSLVSTGTTALFVHGDAQITGDLIVDDFNLDELTVDQVNVTGILTSVQFNITGVGTFNDTVPLYFGNSQDLKIWHQSGGHSYIQETAGTGSHLYIDTNKLVIRNGAGDEDQAVFNQNGSVDLYHSDTKRLATTAIGATVFGDFIVAGVTTTVDLKVTGVGTFNDNSPLYFGDSQDLMIKHFAGGNSYIKDASNDIVIQTGTLRVVNAADNGDLATFTESGASSLYYNNLKRFETLGVGASVLGNLTVSGVNTTGDGNFNVSGISTFNGLVSIADSINHVGNTDTAIRFPAADTFSVETAGSESFRVDSNQRLIIGHTASVGEARSVQLVGTSADTSSIQLIRHSADTGGAKLDLTKSRNATKGSNTIVQDDDCLGDIAFRADDGTDFNTEGARISAFVDGTPGSNDMPGRLRFSTTPDGASTPVERLRINSSGQLELRKDQDSVTGRPDNRIVFKDLDTSVAANQPIGEISWHSSDSGMVNVNSYIRGINEAANGSGALLFGVKAAGSSEIEALRITSGGQTLIGTNSDVAPDTFQSLLQVDSDGAGGSIALGRHTASGSGPFMLFHKSRSGGAAGNTVVQDGDTLGGFRFFGADGTDRNSYGASIAVEVDGTPGSNDMPGRLVFGTTADGAAASTVRLTIDSAGNMGLGITPDTQGATVDSLQIGSATNLYNESSDDYTILGNNVYYDGSDNKYIKAQETSRLLLNAGEFTFNQAGSGSADATITYTTPLKIDSDGRLLQNITAVGDYMHQMQGAGGTGKVPAILFKNGTASTDEIIGGWTAYNSTNQVASIYAKEESANDDAYLQFSTRATGGSLTEQLRIASDGRLLLGIDASSTLPDGFGSKFQIQGTSATSSSISITRNSNSIDPPYLTFAKSRGTSVGSNTAVADDDNLGDIDFKGSDGSGDFNLFAKIRASADGTTGGTDAPGRLTFFTTADGGISNTEKLRITAAGNVTTTGESTFDRTTAGFTARKGDCVSITRANGTPLELVRTTSQGNMINFFDTDGATQRANIGLTSNDLVFGLTSEKVRINTSGELLVNHDSSDGSGKIQAFTGGQDAIDILAYSTTAAEGGRLTFYRSKNATVGSNTEVANDDSLGRIDWRGYNDDGTAFNIGATIEAEVDGAVDSTTDMPSALVFKTSANGSATPTEALRIPSTGGAIVTGVGTFSGGVAIPDDKSLTFGDDSNLYIKHSNGHAKNFFVSSVGDCEFHMASSEVAMELRANLSVDLYYNATKMFATSGVGASVYGTGGLKIPVGNTAQRPTSGLSPQNGDIRYNTDLNSYEGYGNGAWGGLGGGTEIDNIVATTSATGVGTFATATYRSASIRAQIDQGGSYQVGKYLLIHDGTTVTVVEEAAIATGSMLGSFDGVIAGSNVEFKVTMVSAGIATVTTIIDKISV